MVFPQIGLNGSGAQYLANSYAAAMDTITKATAQVMLTVPNGRDYPDEAALRAATADHRQRLDLLAKVYGELDALRRHCRAAMRERTG